MFGCSKAVLFDPYGRRGSRWRLPRWLVLLLAGILAGAAGVLFVQQRYLPPRLSIEESTALRQAYEQAEAERSRLAAELDKTSAQLRTTLAERETLQAELADSRTLAGDLRADLAFAIDALPPDPRDGQVAVRSARFEVDKGMLSYRVALSRPRGGRASIPGVMQLVVAGASPDGGERTVALQPVKLDIGRYEVLRGQVPLPTGFQPRQATIKMLDGDASRQLGMRVLRLD